MKKISVLVFLAITAFEAPNKMRPGKMDSFQWLTGAWGMQTKKGVIMEQWQQTNDSSFAGESFIVKNNSEKIMLEKVQLVCSGNEYFYIPVALGQNNDEPVKFKITSFSTSSFTAENPEHDFPKRITYLLVTKDSIHAFVDGGAAKPEKRNDFYYSRYKN